mmetsp:Transcript_13448/g.22940  ORF Transcript_13448/g.22940 Transcript_13448/m.22940 type:complete len:186 (-) Transcript_13448:580-1137(-)
MNRTLSNIGHQPSMTTSLDQEFLHAVLCSDELKTIQTLNSGANLEAMDECGRSALMLASWKGYKGIAWILLDRGANMEHKNPYGYTSIILAAIHGHTDIVKLLLDRNANVESRRQDGKTALMLASFYGQEEVVRLLLDYGASTSVHDMYGMNSLQHAWQSNHLRIAELLFAPARMREPIVPYDHY